MSIEYWIIKHLHEIPWFIQCNLTSTRQGVAPLDPPLREYPPIVNSRGSDQWPWDQIDDDTASAGSGLRLSTLQAVLTGLFLLSL